MKLEVKANHQGISGTVNLPVSKSFANRYFILKYLAGQRSFHDNPLFPDDVRVLIGVLNQKDSKLNTKDAGTVMRFATALMSTVEGQHILEGSGRMHHRPIGLLVDVLRSMGAEITYLEKDGFPPLSIQGKPLSGGRQKIPAHVSSQFISALLMIAPMCKEALILELEGTIVSKPYIEMTIELMRKMGVEVEEELGLLSVKPQAYTDVELELEYDWSSAAFIYQICALSNSAEIYLPGLRADSFQGDKVLGELFTDLGVKSIETDNGLKIIKQNESLKSEIEVDFTECPDLVQAVVMTCLGLGIYLKLSGLHNLHLKESNRLEALKHNVQVFGATFEYKGDRAELVPPKQLKVNGELMSFSDHRMLMSLAPLALKVEGVVLQETNVASKSFPQFWAVLKEMGFELFENP